MMPKAARDDVMLPGLDRIIERLTAMAHDLADASMLAPQHGQPAKPPTLGQGNGERRGAFETARGNIAGVKGSARDQWRRRKLQRAHGRLPGNRGRSSRAVSSRTSASSSIRTRSDRAHDASDGTFRSLRARHTIMLDLDPTLGLYLARLLHAEDEGRRKSGRRRCRTRSTRSTSKTPRAISASPTR